MSLTGPATIMKAADRAGLVAAAAEIVLERAARAIAERGRFVIALAGGSTPKPLYERLSREADIDWGRWVLIWGDERMVGPDDAESNYGMVDAALLRPLTMRGVEPGLVLRMRGEAAPHVAADEYEAGLRGLAGGAIPSCDLMLLGMGHDAHTASLFPYTEALSEQARLAVANPVPQLATVRLTVTYPLINAARAVLFLVSGADKAQALAAVHGAVLDIERWPSQGVQPVDGELLWLADQSAATLLASHRTQPIL